MSGDGVYSRYLGQSPFAGRYKLTFRVDDNNDTAIYVVPRNDPSSLAPPSRGRRTKNNKSEARLSRHFNDGEDVKVEDDAEDEEDEEDEADLKLVDLMVATSMRKCCGSSMKSSGHREKTGSFRRQVIGPVVYIQDPETEDISPPSRIGDFKISQIPGSLDKLLATWTAPGGDFSIGSVASYRFVFSEDIADLLDPRGNPEVLLGFDRNDNAGTATKFDFSFPHFDRDFYVGAYAFDSVGNKGKISNLVHVRLQSPPSSINGARSNDAEPITAIATGAGEPTEPNWIMIGVIAGVIGVLLLLCIVAITYYFAVTRKRSLKTGSTSSVMNGGSSDETDSSSFDSDIKNIMAHPLGPALPAQSSSTAAATQTRQHLSIGVHRGITISGGHSSSSSSNSPSDPPTETTSATVTPVYWSASQLLSKLDHHHPYGNPYLHQQHPDLYQQHGYGGPQSLQPMLSPNMATNNNHVAQQPASIHNLSFTQNNGGLYHNPEWSNGVYRSHDFPEEYTITVVGHGDASSRMPASSSSCSSSPSAKGSNSKVPPPVMPQPRNITQV